MPKHSTPPGSRYILRATGEDDEPKGPTRCLRLPESLDQTVEERVTGDNPRANALLDLIRKGIRYERLRQAKNDPVLGELLLVLDEMLATRLTEATTQVYKHVFVECFVLRKLLAEVISDARVSSRAAERLLTSRLIPPSTASPNPGLDTFISVCEAEAASICSEIEAEWQHEMSLAVGGHAGNDNASSTDPTAPQ